LSDIGGMVEALIAAGTPPGLAAQIVAQAFAAGVNSANFRGIPVDEVAEKRRAYDRERKRKSTGIPPESTGIPNAPLSSSLNRKRGERLPPEWLPDESDRSFAKQLGWSEAQIDSEGANFRDYWIAKPGGGGCKLDWPATWRKWARSSKVKPAGTSVATGPSPEKISIDEAVAQFARFGRWSRHAPINDVSQAPAELLAKYGLGPDGRKLETGTLQ
jgi:hypothetical protein